MMETKTFRELLGFSKERFHFGSAMIVLAAYFIADRFFSIIYSVFYYSFIYVEKPNPSLWDSKNWLMFRSASYVDILDIIPIFILGILLGIGFRLIPDSWLAALAAIVAFILINALVITAEHFIMFEYIQERKIIYTDLLLRIISSTFSSISIIIGIGLMYLIFKKPFPSILLGAVLGNILFFGYMVVSFYLTANINFTLSMMSFRFVLGIVTGIVLGLVWWFLLWLSEDKTVPTAGREPFMFKRNYIGTIAASFLTVPFIFLSLSSFFYDRLFLQIGWFDVRVVFLILVALSLIISGAVVFYIFIYRIWSSIQDGLYARTTPAFAVGGLFIPFYSLYWIFQVLPGFVKDFNNYCEDLRINIPPLGAGLPLAWCILLLASAIPFVGILANLANIFVILLMVSKITDAVNAAQDFKANQLQPNN